MRLTHPSAPPAYFLPFPPVCSLPVGAPAASCFLTPPRSPLLFVPLRLPSSRPPRCGGCAGGQARHRQGLLARHLGRRLRRDRLPVGPPGRGGCHARYGRYVAVSGGRTPPRHAAPRLCTAAPPLPPAGGRLPLGRGRWGAAPAVRGGSRPHRRATRRARSSLPCSPVPCAFSSVPSGLPPPLGRATLCAGVVCQDGC